MVGAVRRQINSVETANTQTEDQMMRHNTQCSYMSCFKWLQSLDIKAILQAVVGNSPGMRSREGVWLAKPLDAELPGTIATCRVSGEGSSQRCLLMCAAQLTLQLCKPIHWDF